jgi:hypothetical protein
VSELEQCDCGMYEYSAALTGADRRVPLWGRGTRSDVIMVAVRRSRGVRELRGRVVEWWVGGWVGGCAWVREGVGKQEARGGWVAGWGSGGIIYIYIFVTFKRRFGIWELGCVER